MPHNPDITAAGSGKIRLNKALAQAGICSRRQADRLISGGKVMVNNRPARELGMAVAPGDRVQVGERSFVVGHKPEPATIMVHKPVGVVTTVSDPEGRSTVMDLLPPEMAKRRVVPAGRLDAMSEGLLLMTTEGELLFRLTHPRWHVPKVYQILVTGPVESGVLQTMSRGMVLTEGEKLAPAKVRQLRGGPGETLLEMELIQGLNRQIRRMCRDLGLTIKRLKRVRQGPLELGNLPPGKWRHLTAAELASLKRSVGL